MQNPKFFLMLCAGALMATLSVRADDDNPAQAAARAALAAKLFQIDQQGTNATAVPATAAPAAQDTIIIMTNSAPQTVQVPAQAVVPPPPTAEQKAQAAALVAEQNKAQKAAAKQAAAEAKAKAKADKKAAELKAKQDAAAAQAGTPNSTAGLNPQQAAAMAALSSAGGNPRPMTASPGMTPMPMTPNGMGAPSLPISSDKQQRLADLLSKYEANQITPEQYHTQRAAVLAEP